MVQVDQALIEHITARRDALRTARLKQEQQQDDGGDPAAASSFAALPPAVQPRKRRPREKVVKPARVPVIVQPMPAEYRCPVTRKVVEPLDMLAPEYRKHLKVIWWFCPACDLSKRTKAERMFNRRQPGAHPLILAATTTVPASRYAPTRYLPMPTIAGEIAGNWSWCPWHDVPSGDLFAALETAYEEDARWTIQLIREELLRRADTASA